MRLVDAAGDAVEDSRVRVLWKGPQGFAVVATGTADAAGALTIRFQPVPGASYLLYVAHDDAPRRPDRIRLSSLPWTPRDGDVVVEREHLIRGVVRSASGATLPGAIVQYRRRPDLTEFTGADSAGVFTIGDSCAGRLGRFDEAELRAVLTGAEDRDVPWSHVRARTIDAVLVLDPGPYVVVRLPGPEAGETSSLPLETVPPLGGEATLLPGNAITLAGLDSAARYSVFVGPDERGRVAAVRDVSGATAGSEVELTWTQGLRTRGRALIGDRPWSGEIQARTRDKRRRVVATTRSDETGAFEFPGLPPGRWNLYTPDALPWADMDADAGCEDVTLVLDQHRNLRSGK
jgi:hypothetical protein